MEIFSASLLGNDRILRINMIVEETHKTFARVHLGYDWAALLMSYEELTAPVQNRKQQRLNELIEIFLIHARVLYEFFFKGEHDDNCIAEHFLEESGTYYSQRADKEDLRKIIHIINKYLAHPSHTRVTGPKDWRLDTIKITKQLIETLGLFMQLSPNEKRKYFSWEGAIVPKYQEANKKNFIS